jgi:hypothetical protein
MTKRLRTQEEWDELCERYPDPKRFRTFNPGLHLAEAYVTAFNTDCASCGKEDSVSPSSNKENMVCHDCGVVDKNGGVFDYMGYEKGKREDGGDLMEGDASKRTAAVKVVDPRVRKTVNRVQKQIDERDKVAIKFERRLLKIIKEMEIVAGVMMLHPRVVEEAKYLMRKYWEHEVKQFLGTVRPKYRYHMPGMRAAISSACLMLCASRGGHHISIQRMQKINEDIELKRKHMLKAFIRLRPYFKTLFE